MRDRKLIDEITIEYGSVSKMIAKVDNEVNRLREFGGHAGRDGGETLEQATRIIPSKYHSIFYRHHFTVPRP